MGRFSDLGNDLYSGQRSVNIVGRRKLWYSVAAVVVLLSVLIPSIRGFQFGIEFRGGSEFRVSGVASQSQQLATDAVTEVTGVNPVGITTVGTDDLRIQTDQLSDEESELVRRALATSYDVPNESVSSSFIGASWGADITGKAVSGLIWFVILAAVMMGVYFRVLSDFPLIIRFNVTLFTLDFRPSLIWIK
jgi:preprotein translocase subunit SecF